MGDAVLGSTYVLFGFISNVEVNSHQEVFLTEGTKAVYEKHLTKKHKFVGSLLRETAILLGGENISDIFKKFLI